VVTDRVLQTGVTLRCETSQPTRGEDLEFSAEIWVEVEQDGSRARHGGQITFGELVLGEDPTRPLIELALDQREQNLGTAFGDARIAGVDVTRFECYSAPFRVELDEGLREVLGGTWHERDPRS
jgi:hypothetical protein